MTDGTVKIQIAAAPSDGEANAKLVAFLAEVLGVPPSHVEIVAGLAARNKLVCVLDLDAAAVQKRIAAHLD